MVLRTLITLFALSYFVGAPLNAAPRKSNKVRKSLKIEKRNLKKIARKIDGIEKKLERSNQEILKMNSSKHKLESTVFGLKKELLISLANLNTGKSEIKHLLTSIAVNTIENEDGASSLLSRKILVQELKKRLNFYNEQISITKKEQEKLSDIEREIKIYETKERMLLETIAHLEETKKLQAQSYIKSKKRYQSSLKKWQKRKIAKTKKKSGNKLRKKFGLFTPPVEKHTSLDYRKKGVTFLFNEAQPVKATRPGKIVHIGSLSTYGNVVMIDHGKEMITVCLGDFNPRLKKGASVKKGQVIGYTTNKAGKLYFEVRNRDKAQQTIHLLDINEKSLAMKN